MSRYLVSYGAGNVRSLANAIKQLGFDFKWVESPEDIEKADVRRSIQP
jgi:glutamine amidotransferase/cyclase